VLVVADQLRVEALLEEVADADVTLVEPLRVHPVESVHPAGDILEEGADDEVEVVVEQAVDEDGPAEAHNAGPEQVQPARPVGVVDDDAHPRDAAGRDVVDADGRERAAGDPRHALRVGPRSVPKTSPARSFTDLAQMRSSGRRCSHGPKRHVVGTVPEPRP
jgi:hypothetical protein